MQFSKESVLLGIPRLRWRRTLKETYETHPGLLLLATSWTLAILLVNPLRDTAIIDDWSYALTVRHWIETGKYVLNDWAAANIPFQALWGRAFSQVFGYSFISLRISTLTLSLCGTSAFYFFARDHGLRSIEAGLASLLLFASPLVLYLSFTFMTDVPFLAWLIIAMLFYSRAFKRCSYVYMLLGSLATSAAILTRQFGVVLIAAVIVVWILRHTQHRWYFFVVGLAFPVVAAILQTSASPNWTAQRLLIEQSNYLHDFSTCIQEIVWRIPIIFHYLALFTIPLVLTMLLLLPWELSRGGLASSPMRQVIVIALALYMAAILFYRYAKGSAKAMLIPYLPWNYWHLESMGILFQVCLTVMTLLGAILLARAIALRCFVREAVRDTSWLLLEATTLFLLLGHLLFVHLGDRYIITFLPFVLIIGVQHLSQSVSKAWLVLALPTLAGFLVSAAWTRGQLEYFEARWRAAEMLIRAGAAPDQIYNSWEWISYYNFEDYLKQIQYDPGVDSGRNYFLRWMPKRQRESRFWVVETPIAPPGEQWTIMAKVHYRTTFFEPRIIYAVKRETIQ
jgi:4-amino-4-deoxy-L-arabinose transferase-like glycosyltransferase